MLLQDFTKILHCIYLSYYLSLLVAETFSQIPPSFFKDLDNFEEYWSDILSLHWYLKYIFFIIKPRLWVLWSRPLRVRASSSRIKGAYHQHDLSLLMLILITWLRLSFKLPHWKVKLLSTLFSILYSLERNHSAQPLCVLPLPWSRNVYINYLGIFFMWDLSILQIYF